MRLLLYRPTILVFEKVKFGQSSRNFFGTSVTPRTLVWVCCTLSCFNQLMRKSNVYEFHGRTSIEIRRGLYLNNRLILLNSSLPFWWNFGLKSSLFRTKGLSLLQFSYNFLLSSAVFTDLIFSLVGTKGNTKQCFLFWTFSRCPVLINLLIKFFSTCFRIRQPFCFIGGFRGLNYNLILLPFLFGLFLLFFTNLSYFAFFAAFVACSKFRIIQLKLL